MVNFMHFGEPTPNLGMAAWNVNLPGESSYPSLASAFSPYSSAGYSPLSFQQFSSQGEPLPTDFAGIQQNALLSLGKYRYDMRPKVDNVKTYANYGGINSAGFLNHHWPHVVYYS